MSFPASLQPLPPSGQMLCPPIAGQHIDNRMYQYFGSQWAGVTVANITANAAAIAFTYGYLPYRLSFDRIGPSVSTPGAATLRVGVYSHNFATGRPSKLMYGSSTIDVSAGNINTHYSAPPNKVTIAAHTPFWTAVASSAAAATIHGGSFNVTPVPLPFSEAWLLEATNNTYPLTALTTPFTYATLPASVDGLVFTEAAKFPRIWFRAA